MTKTVDTSERRPRDATFSLRLKVAALRRRLPSHEGYRSVSEFQRAVEGRGIVSKTSFYHHWNGTKKPSADTVRKYEELTGVPSGWLEVGAGETLKELNAAVDSLLVGDRAHPAVHKIVAKWERTNIIEMPVNVKDRYKGPEGGTPFPICHIPVLGAHQIETWLRGERSDIDMAGTPTFPIPPFLQAGPLAFWFVVPATDFSMSCAGDTSYPPGTWVVVDPGRPIEPGKSILVQESGGQNWMIRRYKAAYAYPKATEFTLVPTNPGFEPIRVTRAVDWQIGGLIIFSGRAE